MKVFGDRVALTMDNAEPGFGSDGAVLRAVDVHTAVLTANDASASFRNNHAFDERRNLLFEENVPFDVLPVSLELLEKPREQHENVAYLSNTWPTNFYHWMCLTLPLLRYYEAAGISVEKVYVGNKLASWQQRSLELAGIVPDQIVTAPCRAETAHVAVATRHGGAVDPAQIRWTSSKLVPGGAPGGDRRLFVGRGQATTRRMIDEGKVAAALEREFGFEYVITSDVTLDEEIEIFGAADAIVAPYGAALTNVLFARPGISVLELRAHDADFAASSAFAEIGHVMGHRYGTLRGEFVPRAGRDISTDIKISVDTVLHHVEKMLATS